MFAPGYTVWHCGTLKKGKKEMNTEADDWANERQSNTPRTDALFFPYGRDATAAAEPSLLVCMTQYELLERENAAQLKELHRISEALGTNEGHSSVTHIETLKEENAALREQLKQVEAGYATRNDEVTGLLGMNAELREQLAALREQLAKAKEERK